MRLFRNTNKVVLSLFMVMLPLNLNHAIVKAENKVNSGESVKPSTDRGNLKVIQDLKAEEERIRLEEEEQEYLRNRDISTRNDSWGGSVLNSAMGTIQGPSGKETYYNLPMEGVISIMRGIGNTDEYWVRNDGVKMLGDYVMVAANLQLRPRGSLVETSLGMGIVCDTGSFAENNATQLDIAVSW